MKHSLSSGAGYLEIDHRNSPGLTPEDVAHVPGAVAVPGGTLFETDVYQCGHCERTVVLQCAKDKLAHRGKCLKCFHFICNACEAARVASGGLCVPFKQVLDVAGEIAEKYVGQPDHPNAVIDPQAIVAEVANTPKIVLTDMP